MVLAYLYVTQCGILYGLPIGEIRYVRDHRRTPIRWSGAASIAARAGHRRGGRPAARIVAKVRHARSQRRVGSRYRRRRPQRDELYHRPADALERCCRNDQVLRIDGGWYRHDLTRDLPIINGIITFGDTFITVADYLNTDATLNKVVSTTITSTGSGVTWGNLHDFSYTPGFGATGNPPTGLQNAPVWNPANQSFTWDTSGSTRGTYKWLVTATSGSSSDDG